MQLFLSGLGQIVFYAVYLTLFFFEPIINAIRMRPALSRPRRAKFGRASRIAPLGLYLNPLLLAPLLGYSGIGLLPDWTYCLGLSLSIFGIAIRLWGQQTLGRYFSPDVVIYQDHQLVERGPYRFVRHPMYTGTYLAAVGMGLAVQSWVAPVVIALVAGLAVGYRVSVEEKALISQFGEQYVSYSRRVKRLIPFIF